jgi:hypothetical protein
MRHGKDAALVQHLDWRRSLIGAGALAVGVNVKDVNEAFP